jgi:hypothetical protein
MLEGKLDFMLAGADAQATPGDLIRLGMGVPRIFNKSDQTAKVLFWVSPTQKLYDLFWGLHNMEGQKPRTSSRPRNTIFTSCRRRGATSNVRDFEIVIAGQHRACAPMAGSAKQSIFAREIWLAVAPRNDECNCTPTAASPGTAAKPALLAYPRTIASRWECSARSRHCQAVGRQLLHPSITPSGPPRRLERTISAVIGNRCCSYATSAWRGCSERQLSPGNAIENGCDAPLIPPDTSDAPRRRAT